MNRDQARFFGQYAEAKALEWFLNHRPGSRLIARNFRFRGGEIDLIFEECAGRELVFVEVRARAEGAWQSGFESIGPRKLKRISRTIGTFLARYRGRAERARLDVLSFDGKAWTHLEDAWQAPY